MMHPDMVSQLARQRREILMAQAGRHRMAVKPRRLRPQLFRRRLSSTYTSLPTMASSSVAIDSMTGRSPT